MTPRKNALVWRLVIPVAIAVLPLTLGAQNGATIPESKVELDAKEKHGGKTSLHLSGDASTRGWRRPHRVTSPATWRSRTATSSARSRRTSTG